MTVSAIDLIRLSWAHQDWANGRLFAAAARADNAITDAARLIAGGPGDGSIRHALGHISSSEGIWYERWMGDERARSQPEDSFGSITELEAAWRARAVMRAQWLTHLDDQVLGEGFSWRRTNGGERMSSLYWPSLVHVANHGTHHRAEICVALTAAGIQPPPSTSATTSRKFANDRRDTASADWNACDECPRASTHRDPRTGCYLERA